MSLIQEIRKKSLLLTTLLLLIACSEPSPDSELKAQIEALLASQPDLPSGLRVAVDAGRVTISGSLACDDCAGQETPGTFGTVQQSVGAVVRAVPGVETVEFSLTNPP